MVGAITREREFLRISKKLFNWYREAAEQGNASAQFVLGLHYDYEAEPENQDYEQAIYWHRKAAEQGHPCAQYNLGYYYREGYGVSQDLEQAIYWYSKSAEQGNTCAQEALDELKGK